MNDEIKEILDYLDYGVNNLSISKPPFKIGYDDIKKLLDYITNLQQENERLKMRNDMLRKDIDSFINDNKVDYKLRCEKASYLIEPLVEWGECTINGKMLKTVYDILNGSDE